jgi:PAS domain S-box-containing protein
MDNESQVRQPPQEGEVLSRPTVSGPGARDAAAAGGRQPEGGAVARDISLLSAEVAKLRAALDPLNRFRTILDRAGEAIFIIDAATRRIVDANETGFNWLRLPRDRVLAVAVDDLEVEFPLEPPPLVAEHLSETRESERPWVFGGGVHRRRNGTSFPVEVAISQHRFGERDYSLVVVRESKLRRRAEHALREAEEKYRGLFDLSTDAIYLTARDGSVVDVNDAATEVFGYGRADFVGLHASKLYADPQDIRAFQQRVEEAGFVRDFEAGFLTSQGTTIRGRLTATLRHAGDGSVQGYQCVVRCDESVTQQPEGAGSGTELAETAPSSPSTFADVKQTGPRLLSPPQPQTGRDLFEPAVEVHTRPQPWSEPDPWSEPQPIWSVRDQQQPQDDAAGVRQRRLKPWPTVIVLGVLTSLVAWFDFLPLSYPFASGKVAWLLSVRAVGLALVAVGALGSSWRRTARGLAVCLVLLVLPLLTAYLDHLLDLPFDVRHLVPDAWTAMKRVIFRTSAYTGAFAALYVSVAWYLWRLSKSDEDG